MIVSGPRPHETGLAGPCVSGPLSPDSHLPSHGQKVGVAWQD